MKTTTNSFLLLSVLSFITFTNIMKANDIAMLINKSMDETAFVLEYRDYDVWDGYSSFIPTTVQFIEVATGASITLTGDLEVAGLRLASGSTLNLNGHKLTINTGDIETLGGEIDASSDFSSISFTGILAQNFDASSLVNDELWELDINKTNQLNVTNTILITSLVKIQSGDLNVSNATFTFGCKFNTGGIKTAQLDQVALGSTITGEVDVEQCFSARRAFRFVGAPVNTTTSIHANWQEGATSYTDNPKNGYGVHITGVGNNSDGFNGFDWQPSGNPSLFTWDETNQSWGEIDNTNVNTLSAGDAYRLMVRGDRSTNITTSNASDSDTKLSTTGTLQVGSLDLSNKFSQVAGEYTFVANPYQTAVDLTQVYNESTNISSVVWIWDPWLGGLDGRGAWLTYNLVTSDPSNNSSEFNGFLQPYQAVIFETLSNGPVSLEFKESHKSISQTTQEAFSEDEESLSMQVQLYTEDSFNANSTSSDAFVINFTEDGYNGIDLRDVPKMDNIDENLARFHSGELLVVENRAMPQVNEELTLFMNQFSSTDYVLKLMVPEFDIVDTKLVDFYTGEIHDLVQGENHIYFSIDASNASQAYNRFRIEFSQQTLSSSDFITNSDVKMYPNPVNSDYLYVELPELIAGDVTVTIYDTQGRKVSESAFNNLNTKSLKIDQLNLSSGMYILQINNEQNTYDNIKFVKS